MEQTTKEIRELAQIEQVVNKAKGRLTLAEITAETGMPIEQARQNLNVLLERYESKIQMNTETGDLLFNFVFPLLRRDNITFKERMIKVGDILLKVLKAIYKASVGVVLIAYTIFFVLLIFVASMRSNSDDDNSNHGELLSGLFRAILDIIFYKNVVATTQSYEYINDGNFGYRQPVKPTTKEKGFLASVFNFVFGPEKIKYDPNLDALEAIAFIRENNGKLNTSNIVALTGATFDEAESRLAEYIGKYNGEMYISEDGVVTGEFTQLLHKSNEELRGGTIEYYANEIEPPAEFNGNTTGTNAIIIVMNTFNLLMSFMLIGYFMQDSLIGFIIGVFPFIVSLLYFLIPLLRIPSYFIAKKKRRENILRKEAIRSIVWRRGNEVSASKIKISAKKSVYTQDEIQNMLLRLATELQGEAAIDAEGNGVFQFPRIAKELAKLNTEDNQ